MSLVMSEPDLRPGARCPACDRARTASNLGNWSCSRVECPMRSLERQRAEDPHHNPAYESLWEGSYKARRTTKD